MKILIPFFFLLISCETDRSKNFIEFHFADEHIKQDIENKEAQRIYCKGVRLLNKENLKEAQEKFYIALKIEKNPNIYNAIGTVFLNEKNEDSALFYFQKAIDMDPEFWPGYIAKTRTLISQLEYEKAKKSLHPILVDADSQYWLSYANFYLTVISINTGEDCDTIKKYLKQSEFIVNDNYLDEYYLHVRDKVVRKCS